MVVVQILSYGQQTRRNKGPWLIRRQGLEKTPGPICLLAKTMISERCACFW
jgi:hypothetical protein